MKIHLLFACLALVGLGCSNSESTSIVPFHRIKGDVSLVNEGGSDFDKLNTVNAGLISVTLSGASFQKTTTTVLGHYEFDTVPDGNFALQFDDAPYAPATLYVSVPDADDKNFTTTLYPYSWLQVTIDSVRADNNPSLGLNVFTHIRSMDAQKDSVGSVYLYLSSNSNIDPTNAATYDAIYIYETGVPKDSAGNKRGSAIIEQIQPGLIRNWQRHYFGPGSHVFCKACASPYSQQFNTPMYDALGREVYPFFGKYPSNTVEFDLP